MSRIICFSLIVLLYTFSFAQDENETSLLLKLDKTVKNEKTYEASKQSEISRLKKQSLNSANSLAQYQNYLDLSKAYQVYIADSATHFSRLALEVASKLNDTYLINESKIQLASIDAKEGMFPIAIKLLDEIDLSKADKKQKIAYYKTLSEVYIYWMEYQEGHDVSDLEIERNKARDSLLSILPKSSVEYAINLGTKLIEEKELSSAEAILKDALKKAKTDTREYSILTSILAYLYDVSGEKVLRKEYLALSALSDTKASIKENLSLRSLAILLYEEGDIERANLYIKKSLKDANFFNARLRNLQIAKMLPVIDSAYQLEKQRQEQKLQLLLYLVTVLAIIAIVSLFLVYRQVRKVKKARNEIVEVNQQLSASNENLKEANEIQKQLNCNLSESNQIKEQYIHSFLEMCTEYIHRLENFKRIVGGKIKTGQSGEILKLIESTEAKNQELKELYRNFDKAFLNVYRNFVPEVNKLLRPEEAYIEKPKDSLSQELRVYAMIRLGVNDNNQIATFLHYTIRTVYNYRSKVKLKAIYPDSFEEDLMKIGIQNPE